MNYATETATVELHLVRRRGLVEDEAGYGARAFRLTRTHPARAPTRRIPRRRVTGWSSRPPGPRAGDVDDPGAAVRQLAMARAAAGHAGGALGRLALSSRRLGQPAPWRRHHGHPHLGRLAAWGWSLVALFLLGAGDPDMAHGLRPGDRPRRGLRAHLPRDGRGRHDLPPRRPTSRRGPSDGPERRCARCWRSAPRRRRCSIPRVPVGALAPATASSSARREDRHGRDRRGGLVGGGRVAADGRGCPWRSAPAMALAGRTTNAAGGSW